MCLCASLTFPSSVHRVPILTTLPTNHITPWSSLPLPPPRPLRLIAWSCSRATTGWWTKGSSTNRGCPCQWFPLGGSTKETCLKVNGHIQKCFICGLLGSGDNTMRYNVEKCNYWGYKQYEIGNKYSIILLGFIIVFQWQLKSNLVVLQYTNSPVITVSIRWLVSISWCPSI